MDIQTTNTDTPIIDVHRHCVASPFSTKMGRVARTVLRLRAGLHERGVCATVTVKGITSILYPELMDIDRQIQEQDQAGITISLLSFSMSLEMFSQVFLLPAQEIAKRLNDATAALVARYPTKLNFLLMVNPFRQSSIGECERCCKEYDAKGISIGSSWQGKFLDSPQLNAFWEYVEASGMAIFIHPPLVPIGYRQMDLYKLEEVVGRPFDTTMTVGRMIYAGVFDRYPGLKIVLPHMGGGLPNVIGRLDFAYRLGYEGLPAGQAAHCERKPSEYLKSNLYVDTMGFSPTGIKQCIELFGVERVLFGTDYAAVPISPREHIDIVKSLGLSREAEARIFWKNANDLFKLIHLGDKANLHGQGEG